MAVVTVDSVTCRSARGQPDIARSAVRMAWTRTGSAGGGGGGGGGAGGCRRFRCGRGRRRRRGPCGSGLAEAVGRARLPGQPPSELHEVVSRVHPAVRAVRHADADVVEGGIDEVRVVLGAVHEGVHQPVDVVADSDVLAELAPLRGDAAGETRVVRDGTRRRHVLGPTLATPDESAVDLQRSDAVRLPQCVDRRHERALGAGVGRADRGRHRLTTRVAPAKAMRMLRRMRAPAVACRPPAMCRIGSSSIRGPGCRGCPVRRSIGRKYRRPRARP